MSRRVHSVRLGMTFLLLSVAGCFTYVETDPTPDTSVTVIEERPDGGHNIRRYDDAREMQSKEQKRLDSAPATQPSS